MLCEFTVFVNVILYNVHTSYPLLSMHLLVLLVIAVFTNESLSGTNFVELYIVSRVNTVFNPLVASPPISDDAEAVWGTSANELTESNNLSYRLHRDFGGNIRVAEIRVNKSLSE